MLTIDVVDIVLLVILAAMLYFARGRRFLPYYIALTIVALIAIERLVPGTMSTFGNSIHRLDAVDAGLPHVQIDPGVRIGP